ncbi:putative aminopeptidase 1 [Folsomia candida]|uniref:Putative aminopeptidase 1 n=1 Tax=Folsomia candida TaxID=158441 RepID=A0A226DEB6_FOLCA|nr:putative aminopeptidase 1 [Folsomia candida]
MQGEGKGLGVRLSREFKKDPKKLIRVHCAPHKLHLAAKHTVKSNSHVRKFEAHQKAIANFYNAQTGKAVASLSRTVEEHNVKKVYRLLYTFEQRWATNAKITINRYIMNLPILDINLQWIASDNSFSSDKMTAQGLWHEMTNIEQVIIVHTMADCITKLSEYTALFETSGGVMIGMSHHISNLASGLQSIADHPEQQTHLGTTLLENLYCELSPEDMTDLDKENVDKQGFVNCENFDRIEKSKKYRYLFPKELRRAIRGVIPFWHNILTKPKEYPMGNSIQFVLEASLVVSPTSADAERMFSIYKFIKSPRRTRFLPETMDSLMRLHFNGPKDFRDIPAAEYTKTWGVSHHHTGDSRNLGGGMQTSHSNKRVATIAACDAALLAKKRQKLCVDAGSGGNSLAGALPVDSLISKDNMEQPHLQTYFEEDHPYDLDDMDSDMEMPVVLQQTYPNRDPGFLLL